jgi:hypothetical protein
VVPKDAHLSPIMSAAGSARKPRAFHVILRAGLLCGVLDITAAFVTWAIKGVRPIVILQGIASGLLGPKSFQGGWKTTALGGVLHFMIAFTATTVFYDASRSLRFMTRRPILSGLTYGVMVYLVMYWIVMPLSNIQRRPFSLTATVIAIITHMVCVGLPISLVVRRYSK